jgi:hypothetical protein
MAFPLTTGHRSVQTRLLDTTAPGRSLRRASRVAVTKSGFRPLPGSMAGVFQIAF